MSKRGRDDAARSEVDHPGPRWSTRARVMVQSITQPVATNVFETFRDDEAVRLEAKSCMGCSYFADRLTLTTWDPKP
jgi:hypothetical protein